MKSASETGEVTANTATEMSHAPKEITPSPTPSPNPTPEVTSPTPTPNPTPEITSPTPTPNPTREITTPTPSQAPISEVNAPAAARYNTSSEGELQSRVTGFSNEAEARSFAEKVTGNYVPPSDAPGKLNVPSVVVRNERLTDPNVLERPSVPAAVPEVQPPTIGAPDVHGQQRWTFGNDGQAQEFARSFGGQYQEASQIPGEVNQPSVLMRTPDSFTDDFDQVHVRFSGQNGDTLAQEYARSTGGTFVEASTNPGEVNVPSVVLKRSNSVYSISTKLED